MLTTKHTALTIRVFDLTMSDRHYISNAIKTNVNQGNNDA